MITATKTTRCRCDKQARWRESRYPQYVRLQLQFTGRCRVHESQQRSHVVVPARRQDELLDDEQSVFPALTVLHDVVDATGAAELSEERWGAKGRGEDETGSVDK